jgi:hypothetical protein
MAGSPISRQVHYRVRTDSGTVDGTPTWAAAEDTPGAVAPGTNFRVRVSIENTGTASESFSALANIQRCGYSQVLSIGGTQIATSNASSDADGTAVTVQRLTSATGSWANGIYDENATVSGSLTNGFFTEYETALVLNSGVGIGGGEIWTMNHAGLTDASAVTVSVKTPDADGSDFQHGAQLGGATQKVANSANISMTTAAAASSGNLVVVVVSCDNNGTTDADHSEISGVTIDGNAATKAVEYTNGQAAAQGGATTSIWYLQLSGALGAGSTITATFTTAATSGDCNTIQAREFVVASGKTVAVEATGNNVADAATQPASTDATTANIECLRICGHTLEEGIASTVAAGTYAFSAGWSPWWTAGAMARTTGTAATDLSSFVESRVSTGTGDASRIGAVVTGDWASAYVAFRADAGTDFEDGAGSSNVDFTSAGTGTSTSAQPGSANVDISAAGIGESTSAQAGSANVDFGASAAGDGQTSLEGSANVDFSAAAVGGSFTDGVGAATSVEFSAAAVGESTSAQPGSANVDFSAAGIGESTADAVGAATSVDFAADAAGAPLADGAGSANVDFGAAGASPQDGGDAAGDANVDFAVSAVGAPLADADGSANVDFASAAVGASLSDADGSANVDFSSAAVGESTDAQAGSANVDFSVSAAGDGQTSLEGAANVDFSTASVGESTTEAAGAAVVDFASAAVGESTADAVGSANVDFSTAGIGISTADAAGSANVDFSADAEGSESADESGAGSASIDFAASAVGDEGIDFVGVAVIDFNVQAVGSADTFGDTAGTAVVIDFEAAAVGLLRRRPNETIHTSIGGPRGSGSPSGGNSISTSIRSGRSDTEAA